MVPDSISLFYKRPALYKRLLSLPRPASSSREVVTVSVTAFCGLSLPRIIVARSVASPSGGREEAFTTQELPCWSGLGFGL